MRPISLGGPFLLCVGVITASMKLSGEIFAVRHSPYAVSKFVGPVSTEKMAGNIFCDNKNIMKMKKDNDNSRPLNSIHASRVLQALMVGINV